MSALDNKELVAKLDEAIAANKGKQGAVMVTLQAAQEKKFSAMCPRNSDPHCRRIGRKAQRGIRRGHVLLSVRVGAARRIRNRRLSRHGLLRKGLQNILKSCVRCWTYRWERPRRTAGYA